MKFFRVGRPCFTEQKKPIFLELSLLKAINWKRLATFWFYLQALHLYLETIARFEPMNKGIGNRCFAFLIPWFFTGFYRHDFICGRWISQIFPLRVDGHMKWCLILFSPTVFNEKIDQICHPGDTHKFENPELAQYVFHNIDTPQLCKKLFQNGLLGPIPMPKLHLDKSFYAYHINDAITIYPERLP